MRPALPLALALLVGACGGGDGTATHEIEVGMCFDDPESDEVDRFPTVPCDEPHQNEVFHLFEVDGADYPGQDALTWEGTATCRGEPFTAYVGEPYETSRFEVFQILPTEDSWGRGDREIVCALYDPEDNTESRSARTIGT